MSGIKNYFYEVRMDGALLFAFKSKARADAFRKEMSAEYLGHECHRIDRPCTKTQLKKVGPLLVDTSDYPLDTSALASKYRPEGLLDLNDIKAPIPAKEACRMLKRSLPRGGSNVISRGVTLSDNGGAICFISPGQSDDERLELAFMLVQHLIDCYDGSDLLGLISSTRSNLTTKDSKMRMRPEYFTRFALVEPLLTALGYTQLYPESDIFGDEKPKDYVTLVSHGIIKNIPVIIEVEPLGSNMFSPKDGVPQVKDYMMAYDDLSIGVATDGLRWFLVSRDTKKKKEQFQVRMVDLRPLFVTAYQAINYRGYKHECPIALLEDLMRYFGSKNIAAAELQMRRDPLSAAKLKEIEVKSGRPVQF